MNSYYDPSLKEYRLQQIEKRALNDQPSTFNFIKGDLADKPLVDRLFAEHRFDIVVNLAAQAGVRYSIENPDAYIQSNIIGFYNILEASRHAKELATLQAASNAAEKSAHCPPSTTHYAGVQHLIYASSSSVYGGNKKVPFSTDDNVDQIYSTTQLRADTTTYETFGSFSLMLPIGNYTMEVLGYANELPATCNSMTEWVFTPDKVRETFVGSQTVTISNTANSVDISAPPLGRVVPRLEVFTTDPVPEAVKSVRITYAAGGSGINPITGLSSTNTGCTYLIENPTTTSDGISKFRSHLFLATDQQTMNVTLDALDSEGNSVSHKVVSNVPFQRNKVTQLHGALYSAGVSGSFTVNTSWIGDTNIVNF